MNVATGPGGEDRNLVGRYVPSIIAVTVTVVWALSFVADYLSDSYEPSPLIHAAFMLVAGAIFGVQITRGSK